MNQKQTTTARVLLKVTTRRNLSPNDKARSLSTLTAVNVNSETPKRTTPKRKLMPKMGPQRSRFSFTTAMNRMATRGCRTMPTQRSDVARQHSRTFDGGCNVDGFWRAIRIRILPMEAMMDRWKLKAERNITEGLSSAVVEQISSSNVFPFPVKLDIFPSRPREDFSINFTQIFSRGRKWFIMFIYQGVDSGSIRTKFFFFAKS